jgi:hypothetical protein
MFHLEPSVLEKILRPVIIYLFILVALRIGGQREISQTSALQLVLLLSVANAVQNGIIGTDDSVSGAIIGAATLFTVNGIVEILASRSPRIHSLVVGRPLNLSRAELSILMCCGVIASALKISRRPQLLLVASQFTTLKRRNCRQAEQLTLSYIQQWIFETNFAY